MDHKRMFDFVKEKKETFLVGCAYPAVGEDAEFAGSAAPGLGDVNKDDNGCATREPRRSCVEGDGYSVEGAEATDPIAGRCCSAHEVSDGGGTRQVGAHRRLHCGAARAAATPDLHIVHPDPDLIRCEAPQDRLEASLVGAVGRGRGGFLVVIEVVVVVVIVFVFEFVIVVVVVVLRDGSRRRGCGSCHWNGSEGRKEQSKWDGRGTAPFTQPCPQRRLQLENFNFFF
uniref:Uncharacterized protein n=1 Tax=Oryza brachyantha TaxID=4533 RepID=J3N5C9_ORYBR